MTDLLLIKDIFHHMVIGTLKFSNDEEFYSLSIRFVDFSRENFIMNLHQKKKKCNNEIPI